MVSWKWLLAFFTCCAFAENAQPLTVDRLTTEALLVVHGKVLGKTVFREEGAILTEVRVQVFETWKGEWDQPTLRVFHGGGVLGEYATRQTGQAQYAPGEEVVLFLVQKEPGKFLTLGMAWGKFEIHPSDSGAKLASQAGAPGFRPIPLHVLKQNILDSTHE